MDPTTQRLLSAGGESDPLYVDDVFKVSLWAGNGTDNRKITTDIDLLNEGGFLQVKATSSANSWSVSYTGNTELVQDDSSAESVTDNDRIQAFFSDGFEVGSDTRTNNGSRDYIGYSWRRAAKFFDVVTYTGTGSNQTINHNLGAIPRMIWVKRTDTVGGWACGSEGVGWDKYLLVDTSGASATDSTVWNSTSPTTSQFTVGTNSLTNASGGEYVAFIWSGGADSAAFGENRDEQILKIGTYTGSGTAQTIDIGFEPQYIAIRDTTSGTSGWYVFDRMRLIEIFDSEDYLRLDLPDAQANNVNTNLRVLSDGMTLSSETGINTNTRTYLYMAVRKEGTKPITSSSEFFGYQTYTGDGGGRDFLLNWDASLAYVKADTLNWQWVARNFDENSTIETDTSNAEASTGDVRFHVDDSRKLTIDSSVNTNGRDGQLAYWKEAKGALDVQFYIGSNAEQTHLHNLGAVPQMIWVKRYNGVGGWQVYHADLGAGQVGEIDVGNAFVSTTTSWGSGPTATEFTTGTNPDMDGNSAPHLAWLWGNVPGVIDVGSYTGTGSDQIIDCGFSAGTTWVMIKRSDASGNWVVQYDETGLTGTAGDKYWRLDTNTTYSTTTMLDQDNSGFVVKGSNSSVNTAGGNYIYMAIAA